MIQYSTCRI